MLRERGGCNGPRSLSFENDPRQAARPDQCQSAMRISVVRQDLLNRFQSQEIFPAISQKHALISRLTSPLAELFRTIRGDGSVVGPAQSNAAGLDPRGSGGRRQPTSIPGIVTPGRR